MGFPAKFRTRTGLLIADDSFQIQYEAYQLTLKPSMINPSLRLGEAMSFPLLAPILLFSSVQASSFPLLLQR